MMPVRLRSWPLTLSLLKPPHGVNLDAREWTRRVVLTLTVSIEHPNEACLVRGGASWETAMAAAVRAGWIKPQQPKGGALVWRITHAAVSIADAVRAPTLEQFNRQASYLEALVQPVRLDPALRSLLQALSLEWCLTRFEERDEIEAQMKWRHCVPTRCDCIDKPLLTGGPLFEAFYE